MVTNGFGFGFVSGKVLFLSTVLFKNYIIYFLFWFVVVETETFSSLEPAN